MNRLLLLCVFASLAVLAQDAHSPAQTSAADTSGANFIIVLERGPNWLPGKSVSEQPLREHGRYLLRLMESGKLVLAGPFLDEQGGIILLKAADSAEAQKIANEDPGVQNRILQPAVHPFRIAFDSATGASPFKRTAP